MKPESRPSTSVTPRSEAIARLSSAPATWLSGHLLVRGDNVDETIQKRVFAQKRFPMS